MPSATEYLDSIIARDATLAEQNNALLDQINTVDSSPVRDTVDTAYGPFKAGIRQGANAFAGDIEYFKALGNTLIGDEQGAQKNLETARIRSDQASKAVAGLETFEEFTDAPTFSGFLNQVQMGLGQVTPFAAETIAAGLTGFATGGAGTLAYGAARKASTEGAESITKKLVTDIIQKKGRGEALDELEDDIVEGLWRQTKRNSSLGAKAGVVSGTYPINTGESFKEFDEAGVDLTADRALQSLLLGGASTALEVSGEALVLGNLAKLAKRKAGSDPKSILNLYATNIAKNAGLSSVTEGATELGQEGLLVAQRMAVDDSYTQDEANLRLGQALFLGAVAGTAMGGGGAAIATTPEAVSRVFSKAQELTKQGRAQEVSSEVDQEQFGIGGEAVTTQESQADIFAQYDAMQDEGYGKKAVWVAGRPQDNGLAGVEENAQGTSTRNGKKVYFANIKGRGTIFSEDPAIVNDVVMNNATDESVGAALGYSATKSFDENSTIVVQVLDDKGGVVSEEVTSEAGLPAAREAAKKLAGTKGKIAELPLVQAQEQRAQRLAAERGRNMTIDPEEEVDPIEQNGEENDAPTAGLTEREGEQIELTEDGRAEQTYKPKESADQVFAETESLRKNYERAFDQTVNWATSPLGLASDATLKKAIKLQTVNPETRVDLVLGTDNRFRIEMTSLGGDLYTIQDKNKNQRRLPLGQFIQESIARASRRSKFSRQGAGVSVISIDENGSPTGEEFNVNIADMIAAGKRINETEAGGSFDGIDQDAFGLSTIMGALAEQGYELQVGGRPIRGDVKAPRTGRAFEDSTNGRGRSGIPEVYNLVTVNSKNDTLYDLMNRTQNTAASELTPSQQDQLQRVEIFEESKKQSAIDEFDSREPDAPAQERADYIVRLEENKTKAIKDAEINFGFAREDTVGIAKGNEGLDAGQVARSEETSASRLNIEEPRVNPPAVSEAAPKVRLNTEIDAKRNSAVLDNREGTDAEYPLGGVPEAVRVTVNQALKKLQLNGKVVVMNISQLKALGEGILDLSSDAQVGAALQDIVSRFDSSVGGVHYRFRTKAVKESASESTRSQSPSNFYTSEGVHVIILNDEALAGNELELTLTAGHEIGHALFIEELEAALQNPELRGRLYRDFEKAKQRNPGLYDDKTDENGNIVRDGFEEWAADQTAKWVTKNIAAQGVVHRFFKAVANRLKGLWNTLSANSRKRFGQEYSEAFDDFISNVILDKSKDRAARNRAVDPSAPSALRHATVFGFSGIKNEMRFSAIGDAVNRATKGDRNMPAAQATQKIQENTEGALSKLWEIVAPLQTVLRKLGTNTGAGIKIANMLYGRSGEKGLGFLQKSTLKINEIENALEKAFGDLTSDGFKNAAAEARSSKATNELSPEAQKVREFLKTFYDDYVSQEENTAVGFQEDFFPVQLDFDLIAADLESFAEDIAKARGDMTATQVKEVIVQAMNNARVSAENVAESLVDGVDPLQTAEESIELTKGVDRDLLNKYSKPAEAALVSYLRRLVKRVEWNRATKSGDNTLTAELAKLSTKDQAKAKKALGAVLGFYPPLSEDMQKLSSAAQTLQIFTTLSLATISSIPELAAAVVNTREFSGVMDGFKTIAATIVDPKERWEFARDIGVIANDSLANAFMSESDMQYLTPAARSAANKFFEYTGLNLFTKFTRVFASQMALNFITKHATTPTERSVRYLNELGLEADVVKKWVSEGKGFTTPTGLAVKQGLQKFVESTMLRPNAAERPIWASDPRYSLLWQLKSFPYSYGQVVLGGLTREMKARQQEGRAAGKSGGQIITQDLAPHMALFGLAVLPFAILSLELKEKTKYAAKAVLPFREADDSIFKSDNMDWGSYFTAAYGGAGVFGPLALLTSAQTDVKWGKPPVSVFGPTVDTLYQVFIQGDYERVIPFYNQF